MPKHRSNAVSVVLADGRTYPRKSKGENVGAELERIPAKTGGGEKRNAPLPSCFRSPPETRRSIRFVPANEAEAKAQGGKKVVNLLLVVRAGDFGNGKTVQRRGEEHSELVSC